MCQYFVSPNPPPPTLPSLSSGVTTIQAFLFIPCFLYSFTTYVASLKSGGTSEQAQAPPVQKGQDPLSGQSSPRTTGCPAALRAQSTSAGPGCHSLEATGLPIGGWGALLHTGRGVQSKRGQSRGALCMF